MIGRVRDRATFEALAAARRLQRGPISLRFIASEDHVDARVAFAIGRNVGNAVTRNRLRRRLRAAIGEIGAGLEPGAYLFGAGLAAVTLPYEALREHVRGLVGSVRTTR